MEKSIIKSYIEKLRASSTTIDNDLLETSSINAISKIVLIQALKFSTSEKEVSFDELRKCVGLSKNPFRAHIKKLIDAGYCTKEILRDSNGKQMGYRYSFYETVDKSRCYDPLHVNADSLNEPPFPLSPISPIPVLTNHSVLAPGAPAAADEAYKEKNPYYYLAEGTIKRDDMLISTGRTGKELDYAIKKATEELMASGYTTENKFVRGQTLMKYLRPLPRVKGTYEERRDKFYYEVMECAKKLECSYEVAEGFYAFWSLIEVEELGYMRFEMKSDWKTMNYLSMKKNKSKM